MHKIACVTWKIPARQFTTTYISKTNKVTIFQGNKSKMWKDGKITHANFSFQMRLLLFTYFKRTIMKMGFLQPKLPTAFIYIFMYFEMVKQISVSLPLEAIKICLLWVWNVGISRRRRGLLNTQLVKAKWCKINQFTVWHIYGMYWDQMKRQFGDMERKD